jgi:hypothetical protein
MNRRHAGILVGLALASAAVGIIVVRAHEPAGAATTGSASDAAPAAPRARSDEPLALVTVFDDGTPYPDRWVVFHDAEGTVLSAAKSDAAGKVSGPVPDGGMVTVAYGSSIQHLRTIVGVKSGDSIIVGEAEDEGDEGNAIARARVTLPGPRAGAARYTLSAGVAETELSKPSEPLTLSVMERFTEGDGKPAQKDAEVSKRRFRVLGEAVAANGDPLAFAFAWAEVGSGVVDVKLPAWSTSYRPITALITNAPPGLVTARGDLGVVTASANRFVRPARSTLIGANTSLRFLVPEPLGDDLAFRLELAWEGTDKAVLARRQHAEALMRVDLGVELLPRVSNAMIERSNDPARPSVHWSVAGDIAPADATVLRLKWPASGEHEWTIVLPPNQRDPFRLPALPPVLSAWRPDAQPIVPAVALVESSVYENYDEVRAKGIDKAGDGLDDDEDGWLRWSSTGDIVF